MSDLRPAGQQIVSIARSLSHEVRLLIMDEPSAILDDSEIETLFDVVRRLTAEGVGVVYISHRLDEIRRIGDRVTVLREGATVVSGLPASTPSDELVTHMVGTAFEQLFPERATGGGRVLLEVRDLQRLPDVKAASFELHAGEVLGIAGLVGAGRSELLRAIYGVDRRDSGEVVIDGEPLPPGRPDRAIAAGMGLAPEDRKSQALLLEWDLTKNVTLPDVARFQRGVIRVRAEREAAETQLAALHTTPSDGSRRARQLSGGNQQKVVLARWLLKQCKVLLLDEPTRGVDVGAKAELFRIVTDLAREGLGRDRRLVGDRGAPRPVHADPRHARGRAGRRARRRRGHRARGAAPRHAGHAADGDGGRARIRRQKERKPDGHQHDRRARPPRGGGGGSPCRRRCGCRSTRSSSSSWCCWWSAPS